MKVFWVNSAHVKAPAWLLGPAHPFAQCWLPVRYGVVDTGDGLVIVDAGYAPSLYEVPAGLALRAYRRALTIQFNPAGDPLHFLPTLGYRCEDVRDVVLSHLHADHVGHLDAFPFARFHVHEAALEARRCWREGYFAELLPRDFVERTVSYRPSLEVTDTPISGIEGMFAVDLPGHARGQMGIWMKTDEGPVFYGADAAWSYDSLGYVPFPARLISAQPDKIVESASIVKAMERRGAEVVLCHTP